MKQCMRFMAVFVVLVALLGCSEKDEPRSVGVVGGMGGNGGAAGSPEAGGSGGVAGVIENGDSGIQVEAGQDSEPEPACNPPAEPDSFYALEAQSLDRFDPVSMCEFRGKVVLVVNIAAKCGYTPQLGTLAEVQSTYLDQGLVILGFYSNQFANQAGSEEERQVCEENYGVNFEVFDIINVNPPDEHPIYGWFKSQEGFEGDLKWNFEKFLVSRDGQLLGRWPSSVLPTSAVMTDAIESALAESSQ